MHQLWFISYENPINHHRWCLPSAKIPPKNENLPSQQRPSHFWQPSKASNTNPCCPSIAYILANVTRPNHHTIKCKYTVFAVGSPSTSHSLSQAPCQLANPSALWLCCWYQTQSIDYSLHFTQSSTTAVPSHLWLQTSLMSPPCIGD